MALLQPDHIHFDRAHEWWEKNGTNGWASCPLTQNGFVRIVSQARYPTPMPVSQAVDTLAEEVADTDHVFWPDDISLLDDRLFRRERMLGPKQLTDIYLLALAVRNGGRFVTFDRAVSTAAVRGAEPEHLVVL